MVGFWFPHPVSEENYALGAEQSRGEGELCPRGPSSDSERLR